MIMLDFWQVREPIHINEKVELFQSIKESYIYLRFCLDIHIHKTFASLFLYVHNESTKMYHSYFVVFSTILANIYKMLHLPNVFTDRPSYNQLGRATETRGSLASPVCWAQCQGGWASLPAPQVSKFEKRDWKNKLETFI